MLILPSADAFLPVDGLLPPSLLPWVLCQTSLTEKLKKRAGEARLQVLGQAFSAPNLWEKQVLHVHSETVLRREILMWASHQPCWYARTIIPHTTCKAHQQLFHRLEQESLGELIFNSSDIKRLYFVHYPINEHSLEYYWLNPLMYVHEKKLWIRFSIFMIAESYPFFLIEMLLPGLNRYLN